MMSFLKTRRSQLFVSVAVLFALSAHNSQHLPTSFGFAPLLSDELTSSESESPSLNDLKLSGSLRSRFKNRDLAAADGEAETPAAPQADLKTFQETIKPLLDEHCITCHGSDLAEGNLRLDTLNPDLLNGGDTEWWLEVFAVVTKGEMPPPNEAEMDETARQLIVEWLTTELHAASIFRRESGSRSSFRRLTRYEYNYALQDLLGLPWNFSKDLPPDPHSHEGFETDSELLHVSVSQFETYHRLAREALTKSIVLGDRPPTLYWGVSMHDAAEREWPKQTEKLQKAQNELADHPANLQEELTRLEEEFHRSHRAPHYLELATGRTARAEWEYYGAQYAFAPTSEKPVFPPDYDCVAVLPPGHNQYLTVELGNQLPDEGTLRVTVRASRVKSEAPGFPSLQLLFGWQASNEGRALLRVSPEDVEVTASSDHPQIIQWDIPLGEIYPRNSVRKTSMMGELPSPSEYIRLANSSVASGDIQIDFVSIEAPVYDQWPPESHQRIFGNRGDDELADASNILKNFMTRAWRRPPTVDEVKQKLELFSSMRTETESFEQAMLEVLAAILSSPRFLYVPTGPTLDNSDDSQTTDEAPLSHQTDAFQLATRLSLFLWCSLPDPELLDLASRGELANPEVLNAQVDRMLADPRSKRLSEQFVRQWLNLELLEFVNFDRHLGHFDPLLKEAMRQEPVELFAEVLHQNSSVLDFIHADYTMANERLAQHYGLNEIYGNQFRRVSLDGSSRRGGLLTTAGVLAMNSDWPDSHPLKRAIWLLERVLDDPPPPPPPAVPQIDLADPAIAKMTLKERIENHRNHAACRSCHAKIDPWGIAFENFDALGKWRDSVNGVPVDASSDLSNHQTIDGMEGLKRFLLEHRQDQFVEALVKKLTTYALGRPIGFEDRAEIEKITADVRNEGDGLQTLIRSIVISDLFRSP